jgi:exonuclease III
MRIVTYNVNGIGARLLNLLRWLTRPRPMQAMATARC